MSNKNSKRLLFITGNFSPERTGIGKYNGEWVEWLANRGWNCTVITTYPYYPQWKIEKGFFNLFYSKKFTEYGKGNMNIIRCPHYVPSEATAVGRILLEVTFLFSCFFVLLSRLFSRKFDVVCIVSPPFLLGLFGILVKKIRRSMFIYHVQDLQIDAAKDLNLIKSSFIIRVLLRIELIILKSADIVSTVSNGMQKNLKRKIDRKINVYSNWVDVSSFKPVKRSKDVEEKYDVKSEDLIILYSGAIGEKQGLELLLSAAERLQETKKVKFIISGEGPYKLRLMDLSERKRLSNIRFEPLLPYEQLNDFLNIADLHVVVQKSAAAEYVLPSKLMTILAVGGATIVTAEKGTTLYDLINLNDIGIVTPPEDLDSFITAISEISKKSTATIKKNARNYAIKVLDKNKILNQVEADWLELIDKNKH